MPYCLDEKKSPCMGDVLNRLSVTGASRSPRCLGHYQAYREDMEPRIAEIDARYPVTAPLDFDPAYAGESWDEDY